MANVPHTANNNNRTSSFSVPSSRAPLAPSVSQPRLHASGRGAAANNAAIKPSASAAKQPAKSWTEAPSARIKAIKCADPFASKASAFKTRFGSVFHAGEVPCRLHHGAVNVKLHWTRDPSTLNYDPLLVTCAEGLLETEHPYAYASRAILSELLAQENAAPKTIPLTSRMVPSIRAALLSSNRAIFEGGVEAARQLSEVVGEALNEHIHVFVVQMNKRSSDRDFAPKIMKALQTFEEMGGPAAYKVIKAKVPTYCSVNI